MNPELTITIAGIITQGALIGLLYRLISREIQRYDDSLRGLQTIVRNVEIEVVEIKHQLRYVGKRRSETGDTV